MKKEATITFRTHDEIKRKLSSTAIDLGVSISWVINQKLLEMLPDQIKMRIEPTLDREQK